MAQERDLRVQPRKALASRNGRVKRLNNLSLLSSKHVLRRPNRRVGPSDRR